jgi:hypothetical protein
VNDQVLRQKTKTAQKLPADLDLKLAKFPWLNNIAAEETQLLIK